jgi:hypothetical protein
MKIGKGNRSARRKPAPAPLCPPQIPLDQTRDRTRATAVGSQRLTAWAMARSQWQLCYVADDSIPFKWSFKGIRCNAAFRPLATNACLYVGASSVCFQCCLFPTVHFPNANSSALWALMSVLPARFPCGGIAYCYFHSCIAKILFT